MLIRGATNKLQVILGEAATTELPVLVGYVTITDNAEPIYDTTYQTTNDTTAVDILAAAGSGVSRKVLNLSVHNVDNVLHVVTIRHNVSATLYTIWKGTLLVNEMLQYTDTAGFYVLDANGSIKQATGDSPNASYRTILRGALSLTATTHTAATYLLANGETGFTTATGSAHPVALIAIAAADYPTIAGATTKLRIRGQIAVNDTAPTGNFTFGLYPLTRPATSGGAGLNIYTVGTVVTGSNGATVSAPAADSHSNLVGADFALPADGIYGLAVVTTATVAASSHLHLNAQLQMRNA